MAHVKTLVTAVFFAVLLASTSARAADPTYAVEATRATVAVGEKGKASVTISARAGWHLNAEAPLTLKLAPPTGVTVDKAKLVRADLATSSETAARFDVFLVASEPGAKAIDGEASFVLCQESACRPVKEKLALAVDATAAAKETAAKAKKSRTNAR
jgi:hypothetical protein